MSSASAMLSMIYRTTAGCRLPFASFFQEYSSLCANFRPKLCLSSLISFRLDHYCSAELSRSTWSCLLVFQSAPPGTYCWCHCMHCAGASQGSSMTKLCVVSKDQLAGSTLPWKFDSPLGAFNDAFWSQRDYPAIRAGRKWTVFRRGSFTIFCLRNASPTPCPQD